MRRGLIECNTPPEWNIRVLTEDDFYEYCDKENILICEAQLEQPGVYFPYGRGRKPQIILHDELRGANRLFAGYHELAHHWLHPPGIQHFLGLKTMVEVEADIVAACALIPKTLLTHFWPNEIAELYGYPHWIVELRCRMFDKWRI